MVADFGSSDAGRLGGQARADNLSKEERQEIARRAAEARWAKRGMPLTPKATHIGIVKLSEMELECAVLEDGTRVLSERAFSRQLKLAWGGQSVVWRKENNGFVLPQFLANPRLKPFISPELLEALKNRILFRPFQGGKLAYGVDAKLIPQVCTVWLKAREAGALTKRQLETAARAEVIVRGLATIGIIALIDEATGYQADRERDALVKILEAFIAKELRPWVATFEPDFYQELFRLRGIEFKGTLKAPRFIGKLTNDLVYDRLAPGVREELNRVNPANEKGQRKHKNFQWLTQHVGYQKLKQHLKAVTVLMSVFDDWDTFKKKLDRALPKQDVGPLFNDLSEKRDAEPTGQRSASPNLPAAGSEVR